MANRDDIIAKIRAMRAKAEDHAATEAEAMAAAEMAARLLVKHDIKPEELAEVAKSEGTISGFRQGRVLHPIAQYTGWAIQQFTETRCYFVGGEAKFIGLEEDVLMAVYLVEMLIGAGKRAWVAFSDENGLAKIGFQRLQIARVSFFMGFAQRVSDRLNELKEMRDAQRQTAQGSSNATALVVVKSEIIRRTMEEQGITIKGKVKGHTHVDNNMMRAGAAHGDNVNLGRPVHGKATMGEIE